MSIHFGVKAIAYLVLAGGISAFSVAQQSTSSNPTPSTQSQTQDGGSVKPASSQQQASASDNKNSEKSKDDQSKDQSPSIPETGGQGRVEGTSNDRLFYTLPNFLTLQGREKLPPLSAKDKFKVVALGTFDYIQYPWWGLLASISQAENSEPGFGQGWAAYGKRYGATAGDSTIENFMVGAVFPSLLHQDPRFYQSGQGSFFRRSGYAMSRIFVTRSDSGHAEFNYSEIFGSALAAGISTYSYHPRSTFISTPTDPHKFIPSDRTLSNTISVWGTQLTLDTITIMVKEFWPDIHRKISKKNQTTAENPPKS